MIVKRWNRRGKLDATTTDALDTAEVVAVLLW